MTKLKQLRLDKGYTLKTLAHKSNLSISYLNNLENGKLRNITLETIEKITIGFDEDFIKIYYILKETVIDEEKD